MLGFLKKEKNEVVAPVKGVCIPIEKVQDPVFSSKMMGDGFAVIPEDDTVVAPVSGEIVMLPASRHAFGLRTKAGMEVLVHIGIDTVSLNGEGFTVLASQGARVHAGDPVIRIDRSLISGKGFDLTTMVIFTEGYEKQVVLDAFGKTVKAGEAVLA